MYGKLCIVLALFAISVSTSPVDRPDSLPAYVATCQKAYNASDELINRLLNYALDPEMDDPIAHCVLGCWIEEPGILQSDGTVNPVPMFSGLEEEIVNLDELTEGFEQCANQPGEGCKKKYLVSVCLERVADRVKFWKDMH